ncbi:hypothetical protein IJT17_10480, partial [bacterium]|nr:hypothetical protein [bacterium]
MIQIFASSNSRYFVLRRDNELSLYRVPARLWSRDIPGLQSIVGVGNRGDVYFRTITNGLCRLSVEPKDGMEKVSWENVLLASTPGHQGRVEKVVINSDGTGMFAQVTTPSQSLSNSWRNLFGPGEKGGGSGYDHVLYCIGETGSKLYSLPKVSTLSAHGEFLWAISREFTYLVTAVLQKRGLYEFLVYRVKRKEVVASFTLPDCLIHDISIDDYGRVSVELETEKKQRMLVVRDTCNNCYNLPLESGAEVLNVWKDRACWKTPGELAIQRLDGDLICRVSTEPLNSFGFEYYFLFNHNNDISLAIGTDEELIITPVNPDNLANDAKNWRRVSELKQKNEMAAEEQARQEQERDEANRQHYQQLRTRLGDTLNDIKSKRQRVVSDPNNNAESAENAQAQPPYQPSAPGLSIAPRSTSPGSEAKAQSARTQETIIGDIKALRAQFAAGSISQDAYMQTLDKLN